MEKDSFFTIENGATAEYKDRGSRFIAIAFPITTIDEFKARLKILKEQHGKASHFCFAYRLGTDGNNFRSTDAGEPSGSAGKPILGQIDKLELTNMAVVVIRYFGGSLLGIPGLINAYKTAASLVLQSSIKVKKAVLISYTLQFDYTKLNEIMLLIKKNDCIILKKENSLFCTMEIGIQKAMVEICVVQLGQIAGISITKS